MRSSIRCHLLAVLAILFLTFGPLMVASADTVLPLRGVLHFVEEDQNAVGVLSWLGPVQWDHGIITTADGSQLYFSYVSDSIQGALLRVNFQISGGTGSLTGATGSFTVSIPFPRNREAIFSGTLILPDP